MICAPDASLEGFMVAAAVRAASPEVTVLTANTGRREQSVCFFAGGRGPASECRVSRAGAGRAAARQRRGAHLYACGADSLLVLRHSQRPDGDARRRLLSAGCESFGSWGGRQVKCVCDPKKHSSAPYLTFFDRFFWLKAVCMTL